MSKYLVRVMLVSLVVVPAACGGGGGSGGDDDGARAGDDDGVRDGGVPMNPPPAPTVTYEGATHPASPTSATAGELADLLYEGVFGSLNIAEGIGDLVIPPEGTVEQRGIQGADGGSLDITGRIERNDTGWLSFEYEEYRDDGYTLDGRQVFVFDEVNGNLRDALASVRFYNLEIELPRSSFVYAGVVTRRSTITPEERLTVTGSLLIQNAATDEQLFAESLDISRRPAASGAGTELSGTARLYHDVHGWLDWSFEAPWTFDEGADFPSFGGPVIGTGGSGALRVVSLTPDRVSLQLSADAAAPTEQAAHVTWPTTFASQTTRSVTDDPAADAGASLMARVGSEIGLDASFSGYPNTRFLRFQWRTLYRPPDSVSELDAPEAANPRITLDEPGRYLFELEVTEGVDSMRDWVVLTASDELDVGYEAPRAQLVPGQSASVGSIVSVDRSRFRMTSFRAPGDRPPDVTIMAPDGDTVPVSRETLVTSFTAELPGVYQATLDENPPVDFQWIPVGVEVPFLPPVWFNVPDHPTEIAVADVNADGIDDIVASIDVDRVDPRVEVIFGGAPGNVGRRLTLAGGGEGVAAGDLTSDGRMDIAALFLGGAHIFVQQPDGSFVRSSIASSCFILAEGGKPHVADINGDGRADLVKNGCRGTFEYALQQPDGTLSDFEIFDTGLDASFLIEVGDLNDDGIADIVVYDEALNAETQPIGIVYGRADSPPALPVELLPYNEEDSEPPVPTIGDLDGDGRADLAFVTYQSLPSVKEIHIYRQDDAGGLVESQVYASASRLYGLTIADLNDDGLPDLLEQAQAARFGVRYQQDDGTFGALRRVAVQFDRIGVHASAEEAGDFNGDGLVDIAFRFGFGRESIIVLMFGTGE